MRIALERWGPPLALAVMILAPAMSVAILGRNLDATGLEVAIPDVTGPAMWLMRFSNLWLLVLPAAVLGVRFLGRRTTPLYPGELALLAALLVFFLTNAVLPGLFGQEPGLEKAYFYVLALFVALFVARGEGADHILDVVKVCILAMLLASFLFGALRPEAALRSDPAELRLPFVPFRYWGLGSGPNSFGPLALTLLLLVIVRPFADRRVTALAVTSGIVTLLLAQSQTTWIAAACIIPALLVYRRHLLRHGPPGVRIAPALVVAVAGVAAGAAVLGVAILADSGGGSTVAATRGLSGTGEFLTGRGSIWVVAIETFAASPLFGYGLGAWSEAFREVVAMPYAYHAHNQVLQSASVAGIVGVAGLLVYVSTLVAASLRLASSTGGLAPALMTLMLIGCNSEVPFDMATTLVGDTMRHAVLFALLVCASHRRDAEIDAAARIAGRAARIPARQAPAAAGAVRKRCGPRIA